MACSRWTGQFARQLQPWEQLQACSGLITCEVLGSQWYGETWRHISGCSVVANQFGWSKGWTLFQENSSSCMAVQ